MLLLYIHNFSSLWIRKQYYRKFLLNIFSLSYFRVRKTVVFIDGRRTKSFRILILTSFNYIMYIFNLLQSESLNRNYIYRIQKFFVSNFSVLESDLHSSVNCYYYFFFLFRLMLIAKSFQQSIYRKQFLFCINSFPLERKIVIILYNQRLECAIFNFKQYA